MYLLNKDKLLNDKFNMKTIVILSKINEYKGRQIIYRKQNKEVLKKLTNQALLDCTKSTYVKNNNFNIKLDLNGLIKNKIIPNTVEERNIIEYTDLIRRINRAYDTIDFNSEYILQLHAYMYRSSSKIGGKYRYNMGQKVQELCDVYNNIVQVEEIEKLILVAIFVLEFILISPFDRGNLKMARAVMLIALNKNGYEVGKYISLGKIFDQSYLSYYEGIDSVKLSLAKGKYEIGSWIEYFLDNILLAYKKLNDYFNITDKEKITKTSRIETCINSTLGYFTKNDVKNICPDIPDTTINVVFNKLRKENKIEVIAKGRNAKWRKKY